MQLKPKLDIEIQNCKTLIIKDNTLLYDSVTNTGGWSDLESSPYPTMRRQDLLLYKIELIDKVTDIVLYNWTVTSIVQGEDGNTGTPLVLVKYNLEIPDGIYYIKLTIGGNEGGNLQQEEIFYKHYIYCGVQCCVFNALFNIESLLCDPCNENDISRLQMINLLYQALKAAECMQQDCEYLNILGRLQRLCAGGSSNISINNCNCN